MLRSNRGLKSFSNRSLSRAGSGGFTLIELLVVIAILGVMFGMAVSSISSTLPKWRLQEAANEVAQRMQFARSVAVKNHKTVFLQLNNVDNSTTSEIAILLDSDSSGDISGGDTLLQTIIFPTKHTGAYITIAKDDNGTGANVTEIAINGRGILTGGTMPILVTVTSTFTTNPTTYVVNISRSGVARVL